MPVYHIGQSRIFPPKLPRPKSNPFWYWKKVLFHLKPEVTDTQISEWSSMAKSQLGQVPGLISIEANKPLPVSVSRTKGYDMALVAVLEGPEFVEGYAKFAAQSQYVFFLLYHIVYRDGCGERANGERCVGLRLSGSSFLMILLLLTCSSRSISL